MAIAMDRNRVIGKDGDLPWRLPADLAHFREVTMSKPMVMGRHTHRSIGRALDGRRNLVVTSHPEQVADGAEPVASLDEAFERTADAAEVVVIGGATLCRAAMPRTERLYLTRIDAAFDGDTWFDSYDPAEWRMIDTRLREADERNPHDLEFLTLERRR